jgi:hypothetical protein
VTGPERQPPSELMREAASLLHLLGGMGSRHLVLIGGMVPPLLVPNAEVAHLGSADIDFCISVGMTEGATRQYAASLQELISPYFEPASPAGHRWRKRNDAPGLPLIVDFLASKTDDTVVSPEGALEPATDVVEHNLGVRLTPFAIRAGDLVDRDAELVTVEDVDLLYDRATADVDVRYAGPVGTQPARRRADRHHATRLPRRLVPRSGRRATARIQEPRRSRSGTPTGVSGAARQVDVSSRGAGGLEHCLEQDWDFGQAEANGRRAARCCSVRVSWSLLPCG